MPPLADRIADRLVTRIVGGANPKDAVGTVFKERFFYVDFGKLQGKEASKEDTTSHYEQNRDLIISTHKECKGNLSATERILQFQGIKCSRRWLRFYLEDWGIR